MDKQEDKIQTEIMEAILEYLEGQRTLRSVVLLGINAYHQIQVPGREALFEVISELNTMGNQIADSNSKNYSREVVKERFTTMLEKLTEN